MKNIISAFALYLVLALPLSAATTLKGKVGSNGEKVWAFVPQGDGQTTVTLTWSKKNADMFVALDCTVDGAAVTPQPGGFYGGWITADVVGPFKGEPGTSWW